MKDRDRFVEDCVRHHRGNRREYVEVMSGFAKTPISERPTLPLRSTLSGADVVFLMRKHRMTIELFASKLGTTQKRVRKLRGIGIADPLTVRDWIQAITGTDPGPIPSRLRIQAKTEETECNFCGCPVLLGEETYEYVGQVFCSTSCCRKSRGWK
jgi:hypothetical protein